MVLIGLIGLNLLSILYIFLKLKDKWVSNLSNLSNLSIFISYKKYKTNKERAVKFPDDAFTDPSLLTKDERFVLPEGTTAKQALEMVYRGEIALSPQQMRAAIECLQFENPKVSAVAVTHMNGQDFASALDRVSPGDQRLTRARAASCG